MLPKLSKRKKKKIWQNTINKSKEKELKENKQLESRRKARRKPGNQINTDIKERSNISEENKVKTKGEKKKGKRDRRGEIEYH